MRPTTILAATGFVLVSASNAFSQTLPLRQGIYVRSSVACTELSHVDTLAFWGDQLNAQRVEGKIVSVDVIDGFYRVVLDATDIAKDYRLGELEWTLSIDGEGAFTVENSVPAESYRWCFDRMPTGVGIS